uniref:Uncharacterized protein n=1 Tax=Ascaris lumbricoides TaxID=6252 RepID=A0A0M3IVE1_ASCLU
MQSTLFRLSSSTTVWLLRYEPILVSSNLLFGITATA